MKTIFTMLLLFCAMCQAALTQEQICVEQSNFNQAFSTSRGVNLWLPVGSRSDVWALHCLDNHLATTDGVGCWEVGETYIARCRPAAGTTETPIGYISPRNNTVLACPGGSWSGFPANAAEYIATTAPKSWRRIYNTGVTDRNLRITVPANTTRLYLIPLCNAGFGNMVVSVVSGTATLIKETWNLKLGDAGCDFATDNGGGPRYSKDCIKLIATNCGGAVLNFIGAGEAGSRAAIGLCGFIAINDNGDAALCNPYDGVLDPSTLIEVMPYEAAGGVHQHADGPLSLNFGGGTAFWWGLGHWTATNTIEADSEVQSLYYQESSDSSWVDWTSVDTDDTHVRKKALSFGRVLAGNIQIKNGAEAAAVVGTYKAIYSFNASGVTVTLEHTFNAEAVTQGLMLDMDTTGVIGGYGGQWSVVKGFASRIMMLPSVARTQSYTINTGTFTNNLEVLAANGTMSSLFGGAYEAHIQGEGTFLSAGANLNSTPRIKAVERSDTREWIKLYVGNAYGAADIAVQNGDRLIGRHVRMITARNDMATQTGSDGGGIFTGSGLF